MIGIDFQDFTIEYQHINKTRTAVISGYKGSNGEITVPSTVHNTPVTGIGDFAFKRLAGLRSVVLPEGVVTIGEYAFEKCTGLTNIVLPEGLASIKKSAFAGCTGLRGVAFPLSLTGIGANAFSRCTGITSVSLPQNVSVIGEQAFEKCRLSEITVAEENQFFSSIEGVLFDKTGISLIWYPKGRQNDAYSIPEHTAYIGDWAFEGCRVIKSITLPKRLVAIGNYAFAECGIADITFPEGLTSIKNRAFYRCARFTKLALPRSLGSVGEYAFADCLNLETVELSRNVKIGHGAFHGAPAQLVYR
ncbi:MAG: leucine-rich repeat domain-containing protein [Spirochaetaceae bacterium]|jgi:hypothetical protein|nr:leucine-rich repeat domain-containing protein [Spirochaetaceae bacterium]